MEMATRKHAHDHPHRRSHDHSHGLGHAHAHFPAGSGGGMGQVLAFAFAITLVLVLAELAGGYLGHSISLLSDAVHNMTDMPALAISWLAARWAVRPPTHEKTYGYHRAGILAAFVNALLLMLVALWILGEAFERFRHPVAVHSAVMMWIGLLALVINGGITLALLRGRRDLNIRSVLLHNAGDAASNVAILLGGFVILRTGANWVDPAIGMVVGALVVWSGMGILRESTNILLEGMPQHVKLEDVAAALLKIDGVQEIHDVHIWALGTDLNALSCHIRIPDMHMAEVEQILANMRECLEREFHITHTTVQLERAGLPVDGLLMPEPLKPGV
jgi:cobalt-zinc-cadmium efflux system protein